ncbi:Sodium/nucleoside cotransporter [Aphelenchoides besseyi]|nr:Sodium/nucleoside cotransporter [Aphelenchoides besseyi]KAI6228400.1 Sodium/nucleoside cotransporter [Aphelenchoides besseyi]
MGVTHDTRETLKVAQLMGTKTVLNEFIAYQHLGQMLDEKELSAKSAMIATYALAGYRSIVVLLEQINCRFSNFSSVGIQLGILGGMQPDRKPLLSRLAIRALFAGCISCFMTASLAGVLVSTPSYCPRPTDTSNCFNITNYLNSNHNQNTTLLQAFDFFSNSTSTDGHLEL